VVRLAFCAKTDDLQLKNNRIVILFEIGRSCEDIGNTSSNGKFYAYRAESARIIIARYAGISAILLPDLFNLTMPNATDPPQK
jgi:hypothetical protein